MNELRTALELATDEELQELTELLFRPRYNPLDYLQGLSPSQVQSCDRPTWLDTLEQRFRFVAADGFTVLKGHTETLSYRQILQQVCRHLQIAYLPSLATDALEAEIFLHLMHQAWQKLPAAERYTLLERIRASLTANQIDVLPLDCHPDPLRLLLEGGGALTVSAVIRPLLLRQIARQFAAQMARRQAAAAISQSQGELMVQAAGRGLAGTATRYGLMRGALTLVSSALWVSFFADLGWRTIATNYGRVIPVVFTLAQIRLIRGDASWQNA